MKSKAKKENDKNYQEFKIITLGDSSVGKTAILKKYIYNVFEEKPKVTIGMNITHKEITLENNKKIILRLVDTAGTEKYRSLSKQYFKNADGVLFIFSLIEPESFNNIKSWMEVFSDEHNCNNRSYIQKYLIGNKNDLEKKVSENQINDFLEINTDLKYKSISAKNDDIKINELFQELGENLYKNYGEFKKNEEKTIKLKSFDEKKKKNCTLNNCFA